MLKSLSKTLKASKCLLRARSLAGSSTWSTLDTPYTLSARGIRHGSSISASEHEHGCPLSR